MIDLLCVNAHADVALPVAQGGVEVVNIGPAATELDVGAYHGDG